MQLHNLKITKLNEIKVCLQVFVNTTVSVKKKY